MTDLLGGQIQVIFASSPAVLQHIQGGKLVALAVTGPKRITTLAGVPPIAESGLPGYDVQTWHAILFPRGVPAEIISRWNREINRSITKPDFGQRFASEGLEAAPGTPNDFAHILKRDIGRWRQVVERAKIAASDTK